jgi:anti-anti-sigma factor
MSNVAALVARLLAAAPGGLGVAVDFTFVDFIDVVGVNALVEACNRLRSTGSDLVVRAPSDRLRWMLALFELGELIETTRSESNAHLPC